MTPEQEKPLLFLENLNLVLPHISSQPVLRYIFDHLGEPLALTALASQFGFSTRNLSQLFEQRTSLSFSQYLSCVA